MFKKGDTVKLKYSVEKTTEMGWDRDVQRYLEDGMSYVIIDAGQHTARNDQVLQIYVPTKGNLWFYARVFMLDGKKSGFVMNVEEF
jgi:hypothetical protein